MSDAWRFSGYFFSELGGAVSAAVLCDDDFVGIGELF
jgi:hypothetical protein